jgi:hypothetical protein
MICLPTHFKALNRQVVTVEVTVHPWTADETAQIVLGFYYRRVCAIRI